MGWSGVQNWLFCLKVEGSFCRNNTVMTMRLLVMLSEARSIIHIGPREVRKHSSSNGCLFLQQSVTFPRLIWCPKLVILHEIWGFIWLKRRCDDHKVVGYAVSGSCNHSYMSKEGQESLKQQCMPVFTKLCHITLVDLVCKISYFAWNLRVHLVETTLWRP